MAAKWLTAKQTKFTAYAVVYIAIVLAVLGVANFLANRHTKSWDLTANKRFSLSDQTLKIVNNLQQDVKITYFDKSSQFSGVGGAKDLLDRYDALSTKLSVDYVDPDKKPQLAKQAGVRSYGTTFVQVGDRKEEAKSVTEEEITGALIRAMKGGQRTACLVQGSGEHTFDDTGRSGYSNFKDQLERNNYKTQTISLLQKAEVPKECTLVIVGGPRRDYLQPQVDALKNYVEGGGRALIMLDPPVKFKGDEVDENAALANLLASWGVIVNKDLVLDTSGIGQIFGLSEAVPLVTTYESHAIVREMKETATAFPLARSIDTKTFDKGSVEKLFSTSGNAFATTNLAGGEVRLDPGKDKKGPFTLGVAGTYNTGKDKLQGRFVVVGSSGWVANNIFRFNGNRDLAINMMNWLTSDEDLISIRPKEPEDRRLSLNVRQMRVLFFACVLGLPLMIVAAGLSVWWKRR
ncbi:MAG: GldG family protein [Bryobacterales bacterium]|nr:GldG family protein [Bryobacterales bacterium]